VDGRSGVNTKWLEGEMTVISTFGSGSDLPRKVLDNHDGESVNSFARLNPPHPVPRITTRVLAVSADSDLSSERSERGEVKVENADVVHVEKYEIRGDLKLRRASAIL